MRMRVGYAGRMLGRRLGCVCLARKALSATSDADTNSILKSRYGFVSWRQLHIRNTAKDKSRSRSKAHNRLSMIRLSLASGSLVVR